MNILGLRLRAAGMHFGKSPRLSQYNSKWQQYCSKGVGILPSQNREAMQHLQ